MAPTGLFLIVYSPWRASRLEFWRVPDKHISYLAGTDWITMGMLLSLPMLLIGLTLMFIGLSAPRAFGKLGCRRAAAMKTYWISCVTCGATAHARKIATGTGTLSVFGYQMRFDLAAGFPLVTTKRCISNRSPTSCCGSWRRYQYEVPARSRRHHLDEWADENGELGPVYGKQWRNWPTPDGRHIDQIAEVVRQLRTNPDSRRIIVSAWNVGELDQMKLMPCHAFFQFYVSDGRLSCQLYQRSADIFLGRALQHRFLRAADAHAGAAMRPGAG